MRASVRTFIEHLRDPLFRHGYTLVINTAITSGLGMLYWLLAARLFQPEDVGRNAAVISSLVFLSGLAQLNLRPVLSRFVPVAGARTMSLTAGAYGSALVTAAVASAVFLAGSSVWASEGSIPAIGADPVLALAFVGGAMLWTVFALQDGVLIGLRRTVLLTVENTFFGVAKIVLLVVIALVAAELTYGIVASWFVPMLIGVAWISILLVRRLIPAHVAAPIETGPPIGPGRIARFAAVDYLGSLFALSYTALLPVLVIDRIGAEAGGHFYIVWVIVTSLQLVAPQLVASLTVETAADPFAFHVQGRRLLIGMLRILVPAVTAIVVFAPIILGVFGDTYRQESDLLRLLALGILPFSINALFIGVARITVHPGRIVAMQAGLAALILGLTLLLLEPLGLEGVGLAFLVGQSIMAAAALATSLRPLLTRETRGAARPA
jgi:O-antigen/teichoic acid export membrane protein